MSEDDVQPRGRRIFDTTINVQTLGAGLVGAAIAMVIAWFQLVGDVRELKADTKNKDAAQDERMTRIEQAAQQDRADNKDRWGQVAAGMKEQSEKLDKLRDMMIQNSPAGRTEMKRWTK